MEKPRPKVSVLAALVRDSGLLQKEPDGPDLTEAAKQLAARFGLKYDGRSIVAAIASARAQVTKRRARA